MTIIIYLNYFQETWDISKIDEEKNINDRIDEFVRLIKKIHKDIYYINIMDDKLGGIFNAHSIVFGNKKYTGFESYLDKYCIICFKKSRNIRQKKAILRKIKCIHIKYEKLVLEKIKGENSDLKINFESIDFICPIFCIRSFDDFEEF